MVFVQFEKIIVGREHEIAACRAHNVKASDFEFVEAVKSARVGFGRALAAGLRIEQKDLNAARCDVQALAGGENASAQTDRRGGR